MKFSSTSNANVHRCLYSLFQNQNRIFLLLPLFQVPPSPSGQDQQNGKQTYSSLTHYSFKINFKDTPYQISMDS